MTRVAHSRQWIEVYRGSLSVVELHRAELEAAGIVTYSSDANLRMLAPGDTGGNDVFDYRLLVPARDVGRAKELIAAIDDDEIDWGDAQPDDAERVDPRVREVETLGRRIRWSAVIWMFGPWGLWLAPRYFALARTLDARPQRHGLTQIATLLCVLETILLPGTLAVLFRFG